MITFRETDMAAQRDQDSIVSLLNEFMGVRGSMPDTPRIDPGIIQKLKNLGTAKIYLCEDDEKSVGIAVCFRGFSTYKQCELLNIHDFYMGEAYQGRGIGTLFLNFIEQEALRHKFCRITLEVYDENKNAVKLYTKCGFVGNEKREDAHVIYAMKKELA